MHLGLEIEEKEFVSFHIKRGFNRRKDQRRVGGTNDLSVHLWIERGCDIEQGLHDGTLPAWVQVGFDFIYEDDHLIPCSGKYFDFQSLTPRPPSRWERRCRARGGGEGNNK
jgi:hypothetical protein